MIKTQDQDPEELGLETPTFFCHFSFFRHFSVCRPVGLCVLHVYFFCSVRFARDEGEEEEQLMREEESRIRGKRMKT